MESDDPFLWLEEVEGEKALDWVKAQNERTLEKYTGYPEFEEIRRRALDILDSPEKLTYPQMLGDRVFNFWRDAKHERGLLRSKPLAEFVSNQGSWKTVLDLDQLAEVEGENWVYKGHTALGPDYRRTLVWLSRGGSDASVVREFDLVRNRFVEDGFTVPEAKSDLAWRDQDSLYIGTDFGAGTLTDSGYPRQIRLLPRGTDLEQARLLLEVEKKDLAAQAWVVRRPEGQYDFLVRVIDFWRSEIFRVEEEQLRQLPLPLDASPETVFRGRLLFTLRSDWKRQEGSYRAGSLLSVDMRELLEGTWVPDVLFDPEQGGTVEAVSALADAVIVTKTRNVQTELHRYGLSPEGRWVRTPLPAEENGSLNLIACSGFREDYFLTRQGWLTPTTMTYHGNRQSTVVQSLPEWFSSEGLEATQWWARSEDGTRVPYYVIKRADLKLDGTAPTLVYGYGGFEVSLLPSYLSLTGSAWLARGGVYVSTNIRGGGEFGPAWHQAALREKRPRAFEDFEAILQDLVDRKVTSPRRIGIHGASNGGLLTAAVMTRRPDLLGAVLIGVPLLDMRRYNRLLAGASWMAEYGDPDEPEDWEFLKQYSPYHNLSEDTVYPRPLVYTSTRDDRVHPGHARKMVARMQSMGLPVDYYENIEGGHAGVSNNPQQAFLRALLHTYLWRTLTAPSEAVPEKPKSSTV